MKEEKIGIVIPIYNGIKHTIKCLDTLYKIDYKNYCVIVVDDGSTDNSEKIIKEKFPQTIVLKGDGNLWWSGGVNRGIEYALENDFEFILLLNNDNSVKEDFLNVLMESYHRNKDLIICSKVYEMGNTKELVSTGGYFNKWMGALVYYKDDIIENMYVDWCGGMGVLIHKTVFEKIGLFDEINFPQYYGDADFSYRARKEGINILYESRSIVWNNIEQTGTKLDDKFTFKNLKDVLFSLRSNNNIKINYLFYKKHFGIISCFNILFIRYGRLIGSIIKKYVLKKRSTNEE